MSTKEKNRTKMPPVSSPSTKIQSIWSLAFTGELNKHQGATLENDLSSKIVYLAASVTGLQMAHVREEIYWAVNDFGTPRLMEREKWQFIANTKYVLHFKSKYPFHKNVFLNWVVFYFFVLQIEVIDANLGNFSICVICRHMQLNNYI